MAHATRNQTAHDMLSTGGVLASTPGEKQRAAAAASRLRAATDAGVEAYKTGLSVDVSVEAARRYDVESQRIAFVTGWRAAMAEAREAERVVQHAKNVADAGVNGYVFWRDDQTEAEADYHARAFYGHGECRAACLAGWRKRQALFEAMSNQPHARHEPGEFSSFHRSHRLPKVGQVGSYDYMTDQAPDAPMTLSGRVLRTAEVMIGDYCAVELDA